MRDSRSTQSGFCGGWTLLHRVWFPFHACTCVFRDLFCGLQEQTRKNERKCDRGGESRREDQFFQFCNFINSPIIRLISAIFGASLEDLLDILSTYGVCLSTLWQRIRFYSCSKHWFTSNSFFHALLFNDFVALDFVIPTSLIFKIMKTIAACVLLHFIHFSKSAQYIFVPFYKE